MSPAQQIINELTSDTRSNRENKADDNVQRTHLLHCGGPPAVTSYHIFRQNSTLKAKNYKSPRQGLKYKEKSAKEAKKCLTGRLGRVILKITCERGFVAAPFSLFYCGTEFRQGGSRRAVMCVNIRRCRSCESKLP